MGGDYLQPSNFTQLWRSLWRGPAALRPSFVAPPTSMVESLSGKTTPAVSLSVSAETIGSYVHPDKSKPCSSQWSLKSTILGLRPRCQWHNFITQSCAHPDTNSIPF